MMTFQVDDVTPATDALPTRPISDLFPVALEVGGNAQVLKPNGVHPLLHAVGKAFAEHRPLVLSPDAVWLTITRGVAQHVRLHTEELREVLVCHEGKPALTVHEGPWPQVVEQLAKQVGDSFFDCDFSTSTEVERLAGQVTALDAYSPYFGYWMISICGIPSITLTGTLDDWREIRTRVDDLSRFGLEHWHRSLAPITDEFVNAAEGHPDTAFWQRIYNPADAYGGECVTGWVTRFYPYLQVDNDNPVPNPMLDLPVGEPRDQTGPGIQTSVVPATLSRAVIGDVVVDAGLVGVTQHENGALEPKAGWAVLPAPPSIVAMLDRIVAEHEWTPPPSHSPQRAMLGDKEIVFRHVVEGGGELLALYERLGSASLHGGAWRLRPCCGESVRIGGRNIAVVFEHADGRLVGEIPDHITGLSHWVIFRDGDAPADVRVLGGSLALVLRSVLDHNDVEHMETTRLSSLELSYD
ncbi:DUF4419 domain-containing protein [Lentzea sp. NPDC006480]|uniref:DUF4419 domain-containing protein n=1 Tax=Lentzea sp. NPDC006480 TaxID=3157176 RepID=UPI0033B6BCA1